MISILHAEATEVASQIATPNKTYALIMNIIPFVFIFAIFYFLLIRPQKKKQQQHQKMITEIKKGEKVLLNSGFVGIVTAVKDSGYFAVEIAKGVEVEILKSAVVNILKD